MWRDDYLLYCNVDISLERTFNYLLYGISQVVNQNINDRRLPNPTSQF